MITIAAWTHVGLVRGRNEDAIALPGTIVRGSPPGPIVVRSAIPRDGSGSYTLAVIDGMGGHAGGAEASLLAALRLSDSRDDIEQSLTAINTAMYDEMDQNPALRGMGATVAGIQIKTDAIDVFNVGDARAYTHADGYTTLASVDDRSESGSGEITQSLGGTVERTTLAVHRREIEFARHLRVLLCSDGLSEYVPFGEIQDSLDIPDATAAAGQLVALALDSGGPDNVSVVVADLSPAEG
jgi:serine/threonine protein phosphatase PrpC